MVIVSELMETLGHNAFGALKKGRVQNFQATDIRMTAGPKAENVAARMSTFGPFVVLTLAIEVVARVFTLQMWNKITDAKEFDPLIATLNLHGIGTVRDPLFVTHRMTQDDVVVVGLLEPLPPHANLSEYDLGDTVVILAGTQQGLVGEITGVTKSMDGRRVYTLANPKTYARMGEHVEGVIAAVFPDGDMSRYEDIQPGSVRYPVGSVVSYCGEGRWAVTGWRTGVAQLMRLDEPDGRLETVVTAEKRFLAAIG